MFEAGSTTSYLSRAGSPIVGTASALGGPVVILRLSGRGLEKFFGLFSKVPDPGSFALTEILDPDTHTVLDKALVLRFQAPHSFTGEDVIEIQAHGVSQVVHSAIELIQKHGALPALPGEFSFRAVLNNKMSLQQAESLNLSMSGDAIAKEDAQELLNLPSFAQDSFAAELRHCVDSCVRARARVEAAIDFSEAEVEQAQDVQAAEILIQVALEKIRVFADRFERFANAANESKVAIVGEPNAGKSSLLNLLAGGNRAIVSKTAGTTRDVIEVRLRLPSGRRATILDTAGIRNSESEIESAGIELGLEAAKSADALIWVRPAHVTESEMATRQIYELKKDKRCVEIFSHIDLVKTPPPEQQLAGYDLSKPSRRNEEVFSIIEQLLTLDPTDKLKKPDSRVHVLIVSRRQRDLMRLVEIELTDALAALRGHRPLELCGENLKHAEGLLKRCIGQDLGESAIQAIFEQFCLGK
jgi:tRNA modification GTPase